MCWISRREYCDKRVFDFLESLFVTYTEGICVDLKEKTHLRCCWRNETGEVDDPSCDLSTDIVPTVFFLRYSLLEWNYKKMCRDNLKVNCLHNWPFYCPYFMNVTKLQTRYSIWGSILLLLWYDCLPHK